MKRIDRLSAILIHLQSKKIIKASEVADRFDISLRTVYRDIRALEEAGVPIGAETGIGYFLMEGYNLPPVHFNKEEAGALLMASKLAEKYTDRSIQNHLREALFKIKAALRIEEKDYLESIDENIQVAQISPANIESDFPNNFLSDLQTALANNQVVNFDYYSNYNSQFTNRNVEPLSLTYYSRNWHLIGYCQLRQELRDFRSDRIMKLNVLSEHFKPDVHEGYQSYLQSFQSSTDLQEVVVRFDTNVVRFVGEYKYYMGFVSSNSESDGELMTFMTADLEIFARWLLQYTDSVSVLTPALKDKLKQLSLSTYEHHYK